MLCNGKSDTMVGDRVGTRSPLRPVATETYKAILVQSDDFLRDNALRALFNTLNQPCLALAFSSNGSDVLSSSHSSLCKLEQFVCAGLFRGDSIGDMYTSSRETISFGDLTRIVWST